MGHICLRVHDAHGRDNVSGYYSHYGQRKAFRVVVLHDAIERVSMERCDDHVVFLEVETLDVNWGVFIVVSLVHSL